MEELLINLESPPPPRAELSKTPVPISSRVTRPLSTKSTAAEEMRMLLKPLSVPQDVFLPAHTRPVRQSERKSKSGTAVFGDGFRHLYWNVSIFASILASPSARCYREQHLDGTALCCRNDGDVTNLPFRLHCL